MTTSKRKNQHTVRSRGRGTLPVGTNVQESNGVVSVSFDLSEVPPLQRSYSASFAFFTEGDSHETFINFIQQGIESYSSFLRIRLDDLALLNFWRNSKDFYERTGAWYENAYGNKPLDADKPLDLKGVPMFQVSSNLIFASHLESTAIMSFYFFDPRMARKLALGKISSDDMIARPVVEVQTNTYIVWNLLHQISSYVDRTVKKIPSLQTTHQEV